MNSQYSGKYPAHSQSTIPDSRPLLIRMLGEIEGATGGQMSMEQINDRYVEDSEELSDFIRI
jgi:hypothetical protein